MQASPVTAIVPGGDASIGFSTSSEVNIATEQGLRATSAQQQAEALSKQSQPSMALPKRRNGKPQSCEPCRKAKSACDHTLPKCNRCVRKGMTDLCTYHPSPMTRIGTGQGSGVSKLRERDKNGSSALNSAFSTAAASNLLLLLSQQRTSEVEDATPETGHEYLGPTSYNAVIRESMSSFGPEIFVKESDESMIRDGTDILETAPENIQLCMDALSAFPDQETCELMVHRHFKYCDVVMHEPSTVYCLRSLWSRWGDVLRKKDSAGLRSMAEKLLSTPRIILRSCKTSAEWLESFTGDNLRIEMIGNFFAVTGLASLTIPEWDSFFDNSSGVPALTRKQYVYKVGVAAEKCIKLATANAAFASEPLVWLLYHATVLQSQYSGDENGYLWRKAGHLATAVTSLGLHREVSIMTNYVPFMVAELRKRVFAGVFISDKQLATFTGRPPRLSRRYSHCQLCLDLNDDQLMAEGDELQRHLGSLDAEGWNSQLVAPGVTIERGFMIMALLRDEVLEISLGPSSAVTIERRDELQQRCEALYSKLPETIRFDITDTTPPKAAALCGRVFLRLEFLLHKFLLCRLHVQQEDEYTSKRNLTDVSKSILEHIIILERNRDRLADFSYTMTWAVSYFGLQSASVLTIELLKQHQYPSQYRLTVSRSEVVQLLSMFLFCLDMVGPEEGNYVICARVGKMIKRSLDKVLEPPTIELEPALTTPGGSRMPVPDVDMPTMMAGPDSDAEFMEWLTSVDWTRGPWADGF